MAITASVDELYAERIRSLPLAQRLRLLALIAQDVAGEMPDVAHPQRSILELEGVGAELWQGIDAQEYVNKLRGEWDNRD